MLRDDVASMSLGIELVDLGPGTATVRMTVRPDMVNGHAIGHGGYVFLVADTAFACACNSRGPVTVAAGADITFVAAGPGRRRAHRDGRTSAAGTAAAACTTSRSRPPAW